ncbi:hypothetical protein MUN88_06390 [Gracilibacillus caseinilyticus]|uniref:Uncharacterized protein n=1 Tax=Gracilibacillus caseinilyticus TaxID=2932256 RepID=A0ABY4EZ71_9BACI|nr:hypothetical protein [Gracilibacillus caseinilyticus]UOQ49703.1 hypothetical protein MUN88_06390 [Gracilibacillus caseinilyticus]
MTRKKNPAFSKMLKKFHHGARIFAEEYIRAVKNGATVAEKEVLAIAKDREQPVESMAKKLFGAIMLGVLHAAEQMIQFGIALIEDSKHKNKS